MTAFTVESVVPTLRVTNLDQSIPFYSKLGFSLAWTHQIEPDQPRLAAVQHGPVQLFLTEHDVAPVGAVVYLNSRGVDALNSEAAAVGITPMFGPEDRPWAQREVYFEDPDGNVLRFGEPAAAAAKSS